jgi:hypothetical protein
MDPASSVSTAAAVLSLVTFGYKIVTCAAELHNCTVKALEENTDREAITRDIQCILGNLKRPDHKDRGYELEELRKRSVKVASETFISLNKIKIGPSALKQVVLAAAIRTLWNKKDIVELDSRLRGLSNELNLRLTANSGYAINTSISLYTNFVK